MANYSDLFQGHGFIYKDDPENLHTNKYEQAFHNFPSAGTAEEVSKAVKNLLNKHEKENFTAEVLKQIHGLIDLTSLTSIDTKESIWKLVDRVNDFEGIRPDVPNVAAICTYPLFIETVKQALTAQEVKIASVAGGFPSSQTFMEIKIAETGMAVMQGADEIDMVMNIGYFLEENYEELAEEIQEVKESCRTAKLKVILETGALKSPENIQKAAILALYSDADFIKTSTGKDYPTAMKLVSVLAYSGIDATLETASDSQKIDASVMNLHTAAVLICSGTDVGYLQKTAEILQERMIPVILITGAKMTVLNNYATVRLVAPVQDESAGVVPGSWVGLVMLCEILCTMVFQKDYDTNARNVMRIHEIMKNDK